MDGGMNEMTFTVSSKTEDPILVNHTKWSTEGNPTLKNARSVYSRKEKKGWILDLAETIILSWLYTSV